MVCECVCVCVCVCVFIFARLLGEEKNGYYTLYKDGGGNVMYII